MQDLQMTDVRASIDPTEIPAEIDRWNWGAFLLNWVWGVGNNTFIALLTLVPGVGFVMIFMLGARGSRWAWHNGRWDSIAHFKRVQRQWAIWAVVVWLGIIVLFAGLFGGIFFFLKHSDAYQLGASRLQASAEAAGLLGSPITTGIPVGAINITGATGHAILKFSATGPKAAGRIFLEAFKKDGIWSLKTMTLKVDGRDGVIDLLRESRAKLETPYQRFVAIPRDEVASFHVTFA
jgi:hypothetical protein